MPLTYDQAIHCSKVFQDYFSNFHRIDEYMREQKLMSLSDMPISLPGCGIETDLFDDFSLSPQDMNFELVELPAERWQSYLDIISSHNNYVNPGRKLRFAVRETTTQKWVGFVRFGSPTIMMKPRNELLGCVITNELETTKSFNRATMMGFVIVPTQPFGYNYLGGKLLAGICCSHEIREQLNQKYKMNLCMFETTSLYGSTKSVSQYDGMKPYLRFGGVTESDFLPLMHGSTYEDLYSFVKQSHGSPLVSYDDSSKKLKIMNKIVTWTKNALKSNPEEYARFVSVVDQARSLTERKRYYYSNYGFSNFRDVVLGKTDTLIPDKEVYDKFYMDNIIQWWKNKATNRYQTLKSEGRLRTELEVWTSGKEIDIIR